MPTLVINWRDVLRHAWCVRWMAAAVICSAIESGFPFLDGYLPIAPHAFAILAGLSTAAALITRFMAQKEFVK